MRTKSSYISRRALLIWAACTAGALIPNLAIGGSRTNAKTPDLTSYISIPRGEKVVIDNPEELSEFNRAIVMGFPGEQVIERYQDQVFFGATSTENVHHIHDIMYKTLYFNNGYRLVNTERKWI